jgi:hypothetical protein
MGSSFFVPGGDMNKTPFDTLIECIFELGILDGAQETINEVRARFPRHNEIQLHMDRQQSLIDKRRVEVEAIMADVRSRN